MKVRFIIVFILSIFICGCASTGYYRLNGEELVKSDLARFEDTPIPSGFKFLPLSSFVSESGKFRVGVLEYYGKGYPYEIVKFYKNNMPKLGWKILNIIEGRDTIISFEKEDEICVVRFKYDGGKSSLIVSISPQFEEVEKPATTSSK